MSTLSVTTAGILSIRNQGQALADHDPCHCHVDVRSRRCRHRRRSAPGCFWGHGRVWTAPTLAGAHFDLCGLGCGTPSQPQGELRLEAVGTSSNPLSKAAYELVRRRSSTVRARKVAAAAGYIGAEIAKEVPYYAAAFGVAVASDHDHLTRRPSSSSPGPISARALYEYGLGRVTRVYLCGAPSAAQVRAQELRRRAIDMLGGSRWKSLR